MPTGPPEPATLRPASRRAASQTPASVAATIPTPPFRTSRDKSKGRSSPAPAGTTRAIRRTEGDHRRPPKFLAAGRSLETMAESYESLSRAPAAKRSGSNPLAPLSAPAETAESAATFAWVNQRDIFQPVRDHAVAPPKLQRPSPIYRATVASPLRADQPVLMQRHQPRPRSQSERSRGAKQGRAVPMGSVETTDQYPLQPARVEPVAARATGKPRDEQLPLHDRRGREGRPATP